MKIFYANSIKAMAFLTMLICLLKTENTYAVLAKGDIAVIGFNSDGATSSKDFAVVTLATIANGETIYITDKGWTATSGGSFMADITTEGIFSWTTTSSIPKGTVIRFLVTSGASPTVTASPSVGTLTVINGWTSTAAAAPFGTNGDQIIVFQGTVSSPTFVFGFNNGAYTADVSNGWNTTATSGNATSNLPAGLTNGTDAVSFVAQTGIVDNNVYNGTLTGNKAAILAEICNTTKWLGDDTAPYNLVPGDPTGRFPGTNPIFGAAPVASLVSSTGTLQVGQTLTGTFNYNDADGDTQSGSTFKWYRADNGSGAGKAAINLATAQTYQLVAADENKHISFEVTPKDGAKFGTTVESSLRGPIQPTVLPVKLISFTTKVVSGSSVLLSWQVTAQRDHQGFRLYRKVEQGSFVKVADIVSALGQSSYSFNDRQSQQGTNYYRLLEVDVNGNETELATGSESIAVAKDQISVFPNPSQGPINVSFPQGQYNKVELLDANGKAIAQKSIKSQTNNISFDVSSKPNGIFLVRLTGNGKTEVRKVAKK